MISDIGQTVCLLIQNKVRFLRGNCLVQVTSKQRSKIKGLDKKQRGSF